MAEIVADAVPDEDAVQAKLAEIKRKKEQADLPKRDTKGRRAAEDRQRKDRVNPSLLSGHPVAGRDERWTILARPDLVKQVKQLADDLSRPRAKVSIAALMEEAIVMLLAKYRVDSQADEQQ